MESIQEIRFDETLSRKERIKKMHEASSKKATQLITLDKTINK